jgi:hypothetical protein
MVKRIQEAKRIAAANEKSISVVHRSRWIGREVDRSQVVTHLRKALLRRRSVSIAVVQSERNEQHPLSVAQEAANFSFRMIEITTAVKR